ncbi:MAG TPA: type ISP restriction/modification enzyme [Azospirillum sp.]|nr:type ISP restriction/modification enzyme [Azospirillum sp.]
MTYSKDERVDVLERIHSLDTILSSFRDAARTEREKGTYFERLCVAYLSNDPMQTEHYETVLPWAEWAKQNGWDGKDVGIDLVAKLRGHEGFAAIQCKFYDPKHRIAKADIDSFLAASSKSPFALRIVIDATEVEWSSNAAEMLYGQSIPVIRIGLNDLRNSPIDWLQFAAQGKIVLEAKKELRKHQSEALEAVRKGLATHDRGKIIMACGTGKTFTSLKIAEDLVGADGMVLFLVPSLALMAQTVREWSTDSITPLRSFAVCSDTQVGKHPQFKDDIAEIDVLDLAFPATTNAAKLADGVADKASGRMTVVFATYQSIQVVSDAQITHGLPAFDLIICDEAHRTTGATFDGKESNFVRVHRNEVISGKKRLYMTATPRIFGDSAKSKADDLGITLATMDDESLFGPTLYYRGFGWAVQEGLLTDYKVIVLAMDEKLVAKSVQKRIEDPTSGLILDDATRILGCYKALTKVDIASDLGADTQPMRRALAFCRDIDSSKLVQREFAAVVADYLSNDDVIETDADIVKHQLACEIEHVDGTFNAKTRGKLLDWLKAESEENTCRILTNARCLSEGVDVPALDAIMFLHPRKSQIDVVQSVGRVMRRSPGKRMGYVILPVGVPADKTPEEALADNDKYRVVWQILNALRAHDERFEGTINQASLGQDISDRIEIIGFGSKELEAITATVENLPSKTAAKRSGVGGRAGDSSDDHFVIEDDSEPELPLIIDDFSRAIIAKIVKKCGDREYWDRWAGSLRTIALAHITRLKALLEDPEGEPRKAFDVFLAELRDDLNDTITETDAIEMLAQHLITQPVFDVLFEGHAFTKENPVSRAIQGILEKLEDSHLEKENRDLEDFYASVRNKISGLTNPAAKQDLIRQLYDNFFGVAFKETRDRLGIVYTPTEIVDFIIRSADVLLQDEFGESLGSEGVHIIDPFTGTGTFITRLLQSGLIAPDRLEHKFRHEIHANEIILLAYYIAAINIEAVYSSLADGAYLPFEGICLTDTFQMWEKGDLVAQLMPDNSERRHRQRALDIRVIIGNPPYSVAHHIDYPELDGQIASTYAARSTATNKNALYDSYIRAIRWASDRLKDSGRGIIGFITNGGWVDANTADGMRKTLVDEFSSIYVFHLRGNQRTSGETSRREGGKIFGAGSRAPIVITFLVKNPDATQQGRIFYHDIGDYHSREDKLKIIAGFRSIRGIAEADGWAEIAPDEHGDWLKQRDQSFGNYISIGDKKAPGEIAVFEGYSAGLKTARDAWCYNASPSNLRSNIALLEVNFNKRLNDFEMARSQDPSASISNFTATSPTEISWSAKLIDEFSKRRPLDTSDGEYVQCIYRPYFKEWLFYSRKLNERVYRMPDIFPTGKTPNRLIAIKQRADGLGNFALMTDCIIDLQSDGGCQCFPMHIYERNEPSEGENLTLGFGEASARITDGYRVKDGITDAGLKHFQEFYSDHTITKEDLFYYIYGLLHSPDYRARFADSLLKELPRVPPVKKREDFARFVAAGRKLGDLHVGYESVEPYPATVKQGDLALAHIPDPEKFFRVEKMTFGKRGKDKDRSTIIYNANITLTNIPLEAYGYVINGKSAIEWVMERQGVSVDRYNPDTKKGSGIVNDANRYAIETIGNPRYPYDLLRRIIAVSLETVNIVKSLPKLDI